MDRYQEEIEYIETINITSFLCAVLNYASPFDAARGYWHFFFIGKKEFGDCWNSFDVGMQFSNVMEDSQR